MIVFRSLGAAVAVVSVLTVAAAPALAQPQAQNQAQQNKGPPNALQGFSQNRDEPVHIESETLEVRDKEKVATFSGDVRVKQGDTNMRSRTLVVFYEQEGGAQSDKQSGGKPMRAAAASPGGGSQKIKRLEARGDVIVTQKDQTATGETGIFDMKTNSVTLTGNVVMTQGKNVLRGDKLVVDLTTGVSRVESGSGRNSRGRVQGLFLPSGGDAAPAAPGSAPAAPVAPREAPRGSQGPLQLRPPN